MAIPDAARRQLTARLETRRRERWSELGKLTVSFRGDFAYVEGILPAGYRQRLFRLRYLGSPTSWGFAVFLASGGRYEDSVLPSGSFTGTPEEALDCACGLYLGDISAWELPGQRSQMPH